MLASQYHSLAWSHKAFIDTDNLIFGYQVGAIGGSQIAKSYFPANEPQLGMTSAKGWIINPNVAFSSDGVGAPFHEL